MNGGTGGLGKSCLAGKICERFNQHTLIIIHGKLNSDTLTEALKDAFIWTQDENGQLILSKNENMVEKLTQLCAVSFKENRYLILMDGFEQNLEGADKGRPGSLLTVAAGLLSVLLRLLPACSNKTKLLITCRYGFSLPPQYDINI